MIGFRPSKLRLGCEWTVGALVFFVLSASHRRHGLGAQGTVFLWFDVPCHAPAPGKGVQGTRGVHWAAPRGGVQVGGVQLLLPGFCTPRLPGRSTWRPAEYPDNVSITGVFRSLTQPRTNKPIPKSPMSRDAQCAARNLDIDVGLCVGQTGLMGVH